MPFVLYLFLIFLICPFRPAAAMEYFEEYRGHWVLFGEIKAGDLDEFLSIAKSRGLPSSVSIESPGGSVEEAMKFGRLFRAAHIQTQTEIACASSCFLMMVGGTKRLFQARVGLHRPHFAGPQFARLSQADATQAYRHATEQVASYLREMDVPQKTIDLMMSTGSHDIIWVTSTTLDIDSEAHAVSEWITAQCGALTFEQMQHYVMVQALDMDAQYRALGMEIADRETTALLRRNVDSLPIDYVESLKDVQECRRNVSAAQRQSVLDKIRLGRWPVDP